MNGLARETHFHMNGFVRRLVLAQRQKVTRKWPIDFHPLGIRTKNRILARKNRAGPNLPRLVTLILFYSSTSVVPFKTL